MTLESDNEKLQEELLKIEIALYEKFLHLKKEKFLLQDKVWFEHSIIDYAEMIELLAVTVQERLCDEEWNWDDLDKIDESQYDKWIAEYEYPEPTCPRCGGGMGCNYCLMTGY